MKKAISLLLAVVLILSAACAVASAASVLKCPHCGNTFTDEALYEDHIVVCYAQHNSGLVCPGCGNMFYGETEYNDHIKTCSALKSANLECPYCGNKFGNETEYNKHVETCYQQRGGGVDWGVYDKLINIDLLDVFSLLDITKLFTRFVDFIESMVILVSTLFN